MLEHIEPVCIQTEDFLLESTKLHGTANLLFGLVLNLCKLLYATSALAVSLSLSAIQYIFGRLFVEIFYSLPELGSNRAALQNGPLEKSYAHSSGQTGKRTLIGSLVALVQNLRLARASC